MAAPANRKTPPRLVTLVVLTGLSALSMNLFLPSLPSLSSHFATDYAYVQLTVSAYLAVTALIQLVVGPLSDRFGRRPVLIWSLVIFVLATLGCVLSTSFEMFLAFRLIQGAIATGMVLSRAIIRDMVEPAQAASMIGYVTMGMTLMPMVGPVIGGLLDEWVGWQGSFWFLILTGLLVLGVVWADLGETNQSHSSSFTEQFRAYPDLLRSRRFWGYTLSAALASGAFFAFLGGGPYVASEILGMSPSSLGLYFGFIALGYMIGNFISGRRAQVWGIGPMMIMGAVCTLCGMLLALGLFLAGLGSPITLFGTIFFVGLGNGMSLPNANAGIVSVRPHLAGSASGLGGAVMIGGGAALSAVTGALLTPERGAYPLLFMMLLAAAGGLLATAYTIKVERDMADRDSAS
ncbi:Bcr/CflA family efflux MFS transporter [Rhodobacteraceae bacterium KN286]|uniref:Bcr/CflA family efflux transporter n=2 Tax=Oceanomicrobium pacificus TaxID=2692916 RepID=A0A6B0TUS7_9RHOB|nr:Bcr/CflA family efflux MFS transporter [Oceanomicrobium pacificus]